MAEPSGDSISKRQASDNSRGLPPVRRRMVSSRACSKCIALATSGRPSERACCFQDPAGFLFADTLQLDHAEEFVEWLAITADGFEVRICRTQQQNLGTLDQRSPQAVDLSLIADLCND